MLYDDDLTKQHLAREAVAGLRGGDHHAQLPGILHEGGLLAGVDHQVRPESTRIEIAVGIGGLKPCQ
ncbi:hypothetical protein [Streptomyces sp. NPDC058954]|uniref:hypothetical protein n=1 Tax=Streptomyces sp. NPDC058954 TaxID=3346677 RepID=UPI003696CCFD